MVLALTLTACSRGVPAGGPGADPVARTYARLAVALGERDTDSIDYYYGPADWVSDIRSNPPKLEEIARLARELRQTLRPRLDARTDRLRRQLEAIAARADILIGASLAFDEESQALFGIRLPAALDTALLDLARAELARLLPGVAPLAQRVDAMERKFLVPPDRVPAVMERAMAGCREQTLAHVALPQGENVALEYVHHKPWSAYSLYLGKLHSRIQINLDFALTIDRALQLACHEGYPGHHVMHSLQDVSFVQQQKRLEWMVQPAFSPQSWASEALASYAADMAFPGRSRLTFVRDQLLPLAGLASDGIEQFEAAERLLDHLQITQAAVAREFLDARLEWARASAALEKDAVMAHTDEALKYISQFRTYVLCYTLGRERVRAAVGVEADPWNRYRQLLTDPDAATALK